MYYLYSLNHPDNGIPFYIGMTKNPLIRFTTHTKNAHNYGLKFIIRELARYGRSPVMNIIGSFNTETECEMAEIDAINEHKKKYVLMNMQHMYPESDLVDYSMNISETCLPNHMCGDRINCEYCKEHDLLGYTVPILNYINENNAVRYFIGKKKNWNAIRQDMFRDVIDVSYLKIPINKSEFLFVIPEGYESPHLIQTSMTIERAMESYWLYRQTDNKQRRSAVGVFSKSSVYDSGSITFNRASPI